MKKIHCEVLCMAFCITMYSTCSLYLIYVGRKLITLFFVYCRVACSSTDNMPKMKVTLIADEWLSTKGGLSTVNRELAIQLAKDPLIEVSLFMEKCSKEEKELARQHNVNVLEATGKDPDRWWTSPPPNFATDFIIGHSCILGKQAKDIRNKFGCKWVQVVHTDPEELGGYKSYSEANATGEKKFKKEVELCKIADLVVGIGPKLAEVYRAKLRRYKKRGFYSYTKLFP